MRALTPLGMSHCQLRSEQKVYLIGWLVLSVVIEWRVIYSYWVKEHSEPYCRLCQCFMWYRHGSVAQCSLLQVRRLSL